jgi:hypothetical protein
VVLYGQINEPADVRVLKTIGLAPWAMNKNPGSAIIDCGNRDTVEGKNNSE